MKDGQTIGQWLKWDFERNGSLQIRDKNGKLIYYENSFGRIIDKRPKPSPKLTLESLAEQVLNLTEIVTKFINKP